MKKQSTWTSFFAASPALRRLSAIFFACAAAAQAGAAALPAYDLSVALNPTESQLSVNAVIDLPEAAAGNTVEFLLTSQLNIERSSPPVKNLGDAAASGFQGINGSSLDLAQRAGITRYQVKFPAGSSRLELTYRGRIDFPLETQGEEYTRGFRETPGSIGPEGVYLAGSTLWYPYFDAGLVTFKLSAKAPPDWHVISQGDGSSGSDGNLASWDSAGAVDEIYLVGGPLIRYAESAGTALAEVYLHEPDDALARKYLEATGQYIEMYRTLIGPYPYGKFALVENFWETGYGMPSFTLLGPQIIRFPFILTSSYPHEILHNWWGNSVYVDYDTGNWAEGLTAYMADHLIKEQQGQGAEYRRDTLKKYRDFVSEDRDFPLSQFRSRHSAATEAVGYGKTLMGFHMLRRQIGDEAFRKAMAALYRQHRGRRASFDDVRTVLEAASGEDLQRFFDEWVGLTGAADLGTEAVTVARDGDQFIVRGRLVQRQRQTPFELNVPIALVSSEGTETTVVRMNSATADFSISSRSAPLALLVDPQFDLFRLLDARETAPSIGQVFGDAAIIAVLPADAPASEQAAYRNLLDAWTNPGQSIEILTDAEVGQLPDDRAAWLLGRTNRVAAKLFKDNAVAKVALESGGVVLPEGQVSYEGNSLVVVSRHPANPSKAVGWIAIDPPEAFDGVARKLPHYGKYSYLAFTGDEPANFIKGEWQAVDSPLLVDLRETGQRSAPLPAPKLPARAALAELPPLFSAERLRKHVDWLAAPEREGRGLGSAGLEASADYVAKQYQQIGLLPAGPDGSYFQPFTVNTGPDGGPHTIRNVVGYIQGSDPRYAGQAVLITAHYDHLGHGWPDERAQAEPGAIYAGADDNASGVAVLIELARAYADGPPPPRSIVFVALSGEEAGLLGSAYYVANPVPAPLSGIMGVINMDTVGRLGEQPVSVLAAESASDWPHIFRGVGFTTGIKIRDIPGASESSDQQSFINAGVPAVQIFTGAHLDYHRPGDTPDKIDADGMVRVALVVREAATYLTERPEPLNFSGTPAAPRAPAAADTGDRRRVAFGAVPDFAYQGSGVRIESVVPGSPAAAAGIQAGDILTGLDADSVTDLGAFSTLLKRYQPGDKVKARGERDGQPYEVEVDLVSR